MSIKKMDEEKLINLVQKYTCLYDVCSRYYSDKLMKNNAWESISKELNIPVSECKKQWKRLRDNYRKAINGRNEASGAAGGKRRAIKFEKELEFLKPFCQQPENQQRTNLDSSSEDTQSTGTMIPESPRAQSRNSNNSLPKTSQILERYLSLKEMESEKEKHPIDIFFTSMAATVKTLSKRTQAQIKRDVLKIVTDAEIYEFDMQVASGQCNHNEYIPTKVTKYQMAENEIAAIYNKSTEAREHTKSLTNVNDIVSDPAVREFQSEIGGTVVGQIDEEYMPTHTQRVGVQGPLKDDRFMLIHSRKPTNEPFSNKYAPGNSLTEL